MENDVFRREKTNQREREREGVRMELEIDVKERDRSSKGGNDLKMRFWKGAAWVGIIN